MSILESLEGLCPARLRRRSFLTAAGASALALKLGLLDCGSSLFAKPVAATRKARVRALFVRPPKEAYWMSWPGASFKPEEAQAECTRTLAEAAERLGVQLDVSPVPLYEPESIEQALQQLRDSPPDGVIVTVLHLQAWPRANCLIRERGAVPLIVFAPLGTTLAGQPETLCTALRTFVAATPDVAWLADALRMLRTTFDTQHTRICVLTDAAQGDRRLASLGVEFRFLPLSRWVEEFERTALTDEMREMAKHYAIEAQHLGEPGQEDLFQAAKNYVVARRIMAAEDCQGISVDCGALLCQRRVSCGTCLAWSRLLDEGAVAACEADTDAAVSLLLAARLLDRPGFMQDAAPDTIHHTVIGSHCTCATRLSGFERPPADFSLRSHAESDSGVALQVSWPAGQDVTIMKFLQPDRMLLGTGRVVSNPSRPAMGGCRTAVEIEVNGLADPRRLRGHHQLFVAGRWDGLLEAYCQLAELKVMGVT